MKSDITTTNLSSVADREEDLDVKVKVELNRFQHKIVYIAGFIINPPSTIFISLTLRNEVSLSSLLLWFSALNIFNFTNICIAYYFRHVSADKIWQSRISYSVMMCLLGLTYGSLVLLYTGDNAHYQLFVITFVEFCLMGFALGNLGDVRGALFSNICLLFPYTALIVYSSMHPETNIGYMEGGNISYSMTLYTVSIFSLGVTYVVHHLVKRFFRLTFENAALNKRLDNANKFLEQRVKDRTIELEDSLKVVTYQATHDLLTDLPNQRLLLEYMGSAIESASENKNMVGVFCFAINELEKINDGLGHKVTNLVIKTIARRFKKKFENNLNINSNEVHYIPTISRQDIFTILVEPITSADNMEQFVAPLLSILNKPVYIEGNEIRLTANIGVSLFPRDGTDAVSLIMNAAAAMMQGKQQGGNCFNLYKPEDNAGISRKLKLESGLHSAIFNNELVLHYQPLVDIKTYKICGAEALLRWQHPAFGLLSPDEFIPIAEANGLIVPLGEWALWKACEQLKEWNSQGYTALRMAVNLSPKQLVKKNIVGSVVDVIKLISVNPDNVELELTESAAYQSDVMPILQQLKKQGFRLVIDDFGTGYSGLSNLKLFDVDKIKIDKSFVRDLNVNADSRAIISHTIALAKKLNVLILAEGVETLEQLEFLEKNGCDMIQGYYFSRPLDSEAFTKLLESRSDMKILSAGSDSSSVE